MLQIKFKSGVAGVLHLRRVGPQMGPRRSQTGTG
jgi:hypothetical protein